MADHTEQRIEELERALKRERRLLAAERRRYESDLAALRRQARQPARAERRDKEIVRLERKLAAVYSSRTWKAGRVVWRLFHLPKSLAGRRRRRPILPEAPRQEEAPPPEQSEQPQQVSPVDYTLVENLVVKDKYRAALSRATFSGAAGGRNIVMAVSTTDLDEGRGDIFTAIGLGRQLEDLGYHVIYLPRDRWYELPRHTEIYLALLETVDVTQIPEDVTTVAWVRNETDVWAEQPSLPLYDLLLSSSSRSLDRLEQVFPGPSGLLPIGVDTELFFPTGPVAGRRGVVSTVNQWGRERELHTHLESIPIDFPLALFGQQRGLAEALEPYSRNPVSFFALPSLYSEARIVLDDFNHTTAPYGNVNSRVYEAAACGAIVMTNRSVGLADIGLGFVPVFATASGLQELVVRDLASEDAAKQAAGRAENVAADHSYRQRAQQFDVFLQDLASGPSTKEGRKIIGYFPDYRDNPYLDMLWADMRSEGAVPVAVGNSLDFYPLLRAADTRETVFHLNWTAPILGAGRTDTERRSRYRKFLDGLDRLQEAGVPILWTVHNVLPHECADPRLEAQLRQELADRADLIHVMADETAELCSGHYELPASKIRVLSHPSYIDVYPNLVDRELARYQLGLRPEDFIYLHLGKIRPYKGIDQLLDTFDRLCQVQQDARLLVVGEPGRFEGVEELKQRCRTNPNVISNFNRVPDADVQLYMNAADVVVLPYRQILNSGALQLAYSFGKPVVAAAIGAIPQQVDDTTGVIFRWEDGEPALLNAMLAARNLGPEHARAAYERAQQTHYLDAAEGFSRLVAEVSGG